MKDDGLYFLASLLVALALAAAMFYGLFMLARSSADAATLVPNRIAVTPGEAKTGDALMVSFWGAEPLSTITVTVEGAERWKCDGGSCASEAILATTILVQTDSNGHGYFAVGVPCGYPSGLFRIDVGGNLISVPVTEGEWCKTHEDWLEGIR